MIALLFVGPTDWWGLCGRWVVQGEPRSFWKPPVRQPREFRSVEREQTPPRISFVWPDGLFSIGFSGGMWNLRVCQMKTTETPWMAASLWAKKWSLSNNFWSKQVLMTVDWALSRAKMMSWEVRRKMVDLEEQQLILWPKKNTPIDDACMELKEQLCSGFLSHYTWKSELVVGLASFDYAVLFNLPRSQSLESFKKWSQSFGDKKWVNKDVWRSFRDCYIAFVDHDLRYVYIEDSGRGPEVEDMIAFLTRCRELERRRHTKKFFQVCWSCLSHRIIVVPYAGLGSDGRIVVVLDLWSVVRQLQFYLLSLSQDCSFLDSRK